MSTTSTSRQSSCQRFWVAIDKDHQAAVVASRSPQIVLILPRDGRGKAVGSTVHIDGCSFTIIRRKDRSASLLVRRERAIYDGNMVFKIAPSQLV